MRGAQCALRSLCVQRLIVWCLLFALPVYGLSSSVVVLLGFKHFHTSVASELAAPAVLADFRRIGQAVNTAPAAHAHTSFARHHHAPTDASATAVDAAADGESMSGESGSGGSVHQLVALLGALHFRQPEARSFDWLATPPGPASSRDPQPLERPPRA